VPVYSGELWTSRQRQSSSLHEISYRACFKAQLPKFFIELLTKTGDVVYDPFSGRGTTALEAGLLGRSVVANDINPLSVLLTRPRFFPPDPAQLERRLYAIPIDPRAKADIDLSMFFHPVTEAEIVSLRRYLLDRHNRGLEDDLDRWIRMVATNRLTGHSAGFFSVYTLPPNQAVSPERQDLINRRLRQAPSYRDTRALILRKTRSLLRNVTEDQRRVLGRAGRSAKFYRTDARRTRSIPAKSVQLTVTSPPFLNVVNYAGDNWLRCWFNGLDAERIGRRLSIHSSLSDWSNVMASVFRELFRVTRTGGWVAFEVGEVRRGTIALDHTVAELGTAAGFACIAILLNTQRFTKTSRIWGIDNNRRGTNTNRIVVFQKSRVSN
jgi:hypothetical protein